MDFNIDYSISTTILERNQGKFQAFVLKLLFKDITTPKRISQFETCSNIIVITFPKGVISQIYDRDKTKNGSKN